METTGQAPRSASIRARLIWGFAVVLTLFLAADVVAMISLGEGGATLDSLMREPFAIFLIVMALFLGVGVIISTVRSIAASLEILQEYSTKLSSGDLSARVSARLPGEFVGIAQQMNRSAERLAHVMDAATRTADEVATSATELASVSEQIAVSASHVATAMAGVSSGAESQVQQLNAVDGELNAVRSAAVRVQAGAGDVASLAVKVEGDAGEKRKEIQRALDILLSVRKDVNRASEEVSALHSATAEINRFVLAVGRIAEQTNLLALNAAIEAARAGNAGRGFAVVADEVRKLAEQAEASAADIVKLTASISERVNSTSGAMSVGVARVKEIETLSRDIDGALTSISEAAAMMRAAASNVTEAASHNASAIERASQGMSAVARTAENHAASAEEISASTQEQSASCEEMTSSATNLLQESARLRELVGGLRTA
jgi:methyl-accepting chemotaxis protein